MSVCPNRNIDDSTYLIDPFEHVPLFEKYRVVYYLPLQLPNLERGIQWAVHALVAIIFSEMVCVLRSPGVCLVHGLQLLEVVGVVPRVLAAVVA